MVLMPKLNIGLWNAWLPLLFYLLFTMIFSYIINKDGFKRGGDRSWIEKKDKPIMAVSGISFYGILIFSIWVPLQTGTTLFYIGLILYILGIILSIITSISFVTAPMNEVITQGVYKFSRNPIYTVNTLIVISIALLSATWILIIILTVYLVSIHFTILTEEKYCLKKYGLAYQEYLKKVPRYILFF